MKECKTRNRPLNKEEHAMLVKHGEFGEFYPECTGNWKEDKLLWEEAKDE